MRFISSGLGFLAVTIVSASEYSVKPLLKSDSTPSIASTGPDIQVIPNAYIVQLKSSSSRLPGRSLLAPRDTDAHSLFHKRASHIDYDVRQEFQNPDLFLGISINLKEGNSTLEAVKNELSSIPDVLGVWPVMEYQNSFPYPINAVSNVSVPDSKSKRDSVYSKIAIKGGTYTALSMSDVDKLHELGIKGKGMKIGIVDSGVDYRHPSLGGGFGPGFKIAGGYDFVGDAYDFRHGPVENPSPLTTCSVGGHGTHVSGIIGMQDPEDMGFGLVGVAPEAGMYMYRIFGCNGYTTTEMIIKGMVAAGEEGVDVISMSLGGDFGFEEVDPFAITTANLVAKGIGMVIAAGNSGGAGNYRTSAPAISPHALAVGSISATDWPLLYEGVDSRGRGFKYTSIWPLEYPEGLTAWYMGLDGTLGLSGCEYDAWVEASNTVVDKNNTIMILTKENDCTSISYWYSFGFNNVLVIDQSDAADIYSYDRHLSPTTDVVAPIEVSALDGAVLTSNHKKSGGYPKYKIKFDNNVASVAKQSSGGLMSNYTSWGPTWDTLALKPQLSAAGGNILATWPLGNGEGYAIISGTSMATPFTAGCYALVKSQFPTLSVEEVYAVLQSTSEPIEYAFDSSIYASTAQQGSGLVNPYKAINLESTVSPRQFALGDLRSFKNKTYSFVIKNKSTRSKTYKISHQGAGYSEHYPYLYVNYDPTYWYQFGQPQLAKYGGAQFSATEVKIAAGKSATVEVVFHPPTDVDEKKNPVFSGLIQIANNNDHFTIPYMGLPYSRYDAQMFDITATEPWLPAFEAIAELHHDPINFWDIIPEPATSVNYYNVSTYIQDDIWVRWNNLQYSPEMLVHLLPANTTFEPDFYGFDRTVQIDYQPSSHPYNDTLFGKPAFFDYSFNSGAQYLQPHYWGWVFTPGSIWHRIGGEDMFNYQLPVGDYRLVLSFQKAGGEVGKRESYWSWMSAVLRVIY